MVKFIKIALDVIELFNDFNMSHFRSDVQTTFLNNIG